MIIPFALALALPLLHNQQGQGDGTNPFAGVEIRQDILLNGDKTPAGLMMRQPQGPLPTPKKGSKTFGVDKIKFDFDWITWGFAKTDPTSENMPLRFRVYSQERVPEHDTSLDVMRMLLRLWKLNQTRLKVDHGERYYYQLVNVYLTYGGVPGGEQFISNDIEGGRQVVANNIYIYDISTFKGAVEQAREIAHEYGHATLPAVGPYQAPEDWANGFFGEKLYLSWIRDILAAKALDPEDFMGVSKEQLDGWLATNVDPLVLDAATNRATMATLADRSKKGMDNFLGLAVYMSKILPAPVYARLLKMGTQDAREWLNSIKLAVEEPATLTLTIPAELQNKPIWVPTAGGKLVGAKILKFDQGWTQIVAGRDPVTVTPRR